MSLDTRRMREREVRSVPGEKSRWPGPLPGQEKASSGQSGGCGRLCRERRAGSRLRVHTGTRGGKAAEDMNRWRVCENLCKLRYVSFALPDHKDVMRALDLATGLPAGVRTGVRQTDRQQGAPGLAHVKHRAPGE